MGRDRESEGEREVGGIEYRETEKTMSLYRLHNIGYRLTH